MLVIALGIVSALAGCAGPEPARVKQEEIVVAAAANLTDAFEELGKRFTEKTGVRVVNSYGSSADLARQIENGAPFDVYAAADVKNVEGLEAKGQLSDGSKAIYARGRLVLWFPRDDAATGARVADLARANVSRVAVAKPEVAPYGEAAVEALRALNLWAQVEPKIVYAQNVAQAKQFAASGNADAAFIPRSLLKAGEGASVEIEATLHHPIDQALGIVKASKRQEAARQFRDFVLGPEGQALLENYGYQRAAVGNIDSSDKEKPFEKKADLFNTIDVDKLIVSKPRVPVNDQPDQHSPTIYRTFLKPDGEYLTWIGAHYGEIHFAFRFDVGGRPFCYRITFTPIRTGKEKSDPSMRPLINLTTEFRDEDGDGKFETSRNILEDGYTPKAPSWAVQ